MTELRRLLEHYVDDGSLPGAVAVVARGDDLEVAVAGSGMRRDSIFRLASVTKPITAAALLMLVDDGSVRLDDPIAKWLPELASPMVVRTPSSPVDDLVPARRQVTVFDVLTSQAGWGFPSDFGLPGIQALFPGTT